MRFALAALILVLPVTPPARALHLQQTVVFRFNPPDGQKFTVTRRVVDRLKFDGTEQTLPGPETVSTYTFRRTPGGVELDVRPVVKASDERRLESFQHLAEALMTDAHLTIRFDNRGSFLGLSGMETMTETLLRSVPKEARSFVSKLLPYSIVMYEEYWKGRYANFIGRDFPIGKYASGDMPMLTAGGRIETTVEMGVKETLGCPAGRCAVIMSGYTSQDPKLGEMMRGTIMDLLTTAIRDMAPAEGQPAGPALRRLRTEMPTLDIDQVWVINERLIDPQTMTIYGEVDRTVMKLRLTTRDGQVSSGATERRIEYDYRYGQ